MMFEVRERKGQTERKVVAHKLCCVVVVDYWASWVVVKAGKIEGYMMTVKNNLIQKKRKIIPPPNTIRNIKPNVYKTCINIFYVYIFS